MPNSTQVSSHLSGAPSISVSMKLEIEIYGNKSSPSIIPSLSESSGFIPNSRQCKLHISGIPSLSLSSNPIMDIRGYPS